MTDTQTQEALAEIGRRILKKNHPEKIILFGSHARHTAGADSDADLLVVMNVSGSKRKQAVEIDLALEGIPIPTDVIVVTPEEVKKYRHCMGTLIREALLEGKVLYERAAWRSGRSPSLGGESRARSSCGGAHHAACKTGVD